MVYLLSAWITLLKTQENSNCGLQHPTRLQPHPFLVLKNPSHYFQGTSIIGRKEKSITHHCEDLKVKLGSLDSGYILIALRPPELQCGLSCAPSLRMQGTTLTPTTKCLGGADTQHMLCAGLWDSHHRKYMDSLRC